MGVVSSSGLVWRRKRNRVDCQERGPEGPKLMFLTHASRREYNTTMLVIILALLLEMVLQSFDDDA